MITDIALIVLLALILNYLFSKAGLPGLLGMIITGIVLGPGWLNVIDEEILLLLREFKMAALIVILIRAGLGINKKTLNKVGRPAIRMSFIPGVFEGLTVLFVVHFLLGFTWIEGGILGFIIAAVSPAVVVPQMLELKEEGFGRKKEVPTLVLAGASVDDVFAITIFGVFIGLASGATVNIAYQAVTVPLGIIIGAAIGVGIGFMLIWYFKRFHIRDTKKVIIFMIVAVLFVEFTEIQQIKDIISIAGLLGVMAIGFIILENYPVLAKRLASKFGKVWVLAEILLFVYIGTEVKILEIDSRLIGVGVLILLTGLLARSTGVWLSLLRSKLDRKEKLFCIIAYLPKATVQAAIGAIPLSMINNGEITSMTVETGQTILTIAVLSIIVTAPIGSIGIKIGGPRLLKRQ